VLVITDRTELDEQIEKVFKGVNEEIVRTKSGADLIAKLNDTNPWLLCSLIHKFGGKDEDEGDGDIAGYTGGPRQAAHREPLTERRAEAVKRKLTRWRFNGSMRAAFQCAQAAERHPKAPEYQVNVRCEPAHIRA